MFGYVAGGNSFGAGFDGLLPISVDGITEEAFPAGNDVIGFRAHAWYQRHITAGVYATLSTRFLQFAHNFKVNDNEARIADGAYDRIFDALLNVAYQF